jgi:hypothetical protein
MKTWSLTQTKQCVNFPWKVDSDLSKIPSYDRGQHRNIAQTIVDDGILDPHRPVRFMGCHNSTDDNDLECIGWLNNQRNYNNIGLRLMMRICENVRDIEVFGEQHRNFKDTLK